MDAIKVNSQMPKSGSTLKKIKAADALKLKDVRRTTVLTEVAQSFGKLMRFIGIGKPVEVKVNFAQASDRGQRDYQQDETYVGESQSGAVIGVLADGMGGHVSGGVAASAGRPPAAGSSASACSSGVPFAFGAPVDPGAVLVAVSDDRDSRKLISICSSGISASGGSLLGGTQLGANTSVPPFRTKDVRSAFSFWSG